MSYTPRTTTPETGDLRFTMSSAGGYVTTDFPGSPQAWAGSVLANCVGYVHGRWMEIGNTNTDYRLSHGDAKTYYPQAEGIFERGQEPKLGAILCLDGSNISSSNAGHVAIVEEIYENGDVMVSESNYGRAVFEYVRRYKSTGYKRAGGTVGGFQGFIYHPDVTPVIPEYAIKIYNGVASKYIAKEGETITISAFKKPGYKFVRWACEGVTLQSITRKETSFIMPANDVYITAIFIEIKGIKKAYQVYNGGII